MNNELQKQIVDIAPYMFRYDGWDDIQQSLLGFGFECGDGWYEILKELVTQIAVVDVGKGMRVIQVKEKYGTLRFYFSLVNETKSEDHTIWDKICNLIDDAEEKSSVTCEECGKLGTLNEYGWIRCLCDTCRNKRNG